MLKMKDKLNQCLESIIESNDDFEADKQLFEDLKSSNLYHLYAQQSDIISERLHELFLEEFDD
jgi:hypothetical protein